MRKIIIFIATFFLCFCLFSCNSVKVNDDFENEIGAFEITAIQRELAANNNMNLPVLDAGRGNPNWIHTLSRYAFARLEEFALNECERTYSNGDMAGQANHEGIGNRFKKYLNSNNKTDKFLLDSLDYCTNELKLNEDEFVKELVDGIIGDYYPSPSRCLRNTEIILSKYIESTLFNGNDIGNTKIFPTEGGSAAICYIFDSLNHNRLLKKGDKIAIATPIFTPYLQIPDVNNYGLVSVDVETNIDDNWEINDEEIDKLINKDIKAFFLVNPSNPSAHALSSDTINKLKEVIEKNPDLIIITDDVYGTFVNNFETLYSAIPYNTILVYSFSKLYGATGWRIGLIAINENNVFDKLISKLNNEDKNYLFNEYSLVTDDPDNFPFVERIVADSRSIGLYHTSGLSTPQQIFMDLLALSHLVKDVDDYIDLSNEIINTRYLTLMNGLHLEPDLNEGNSKYYVLIDIYHLLETNYSKEFADYMISTFSELDILNELASKMGVVLMYGPGFEAKDYTMRVSLANLNNEDYIELSNRILLYFGEYFDNYS